MKATAPATPQPSEGRFYRSSADHLVDELERLDALLRHQVSVIRERDRKAPGLQTSKGIYIADDEVDALLAERPHHADTPAADGSARSQALDDQIAVKVTGTAERGVVLTLPRLGQLFALSPVEMQVLVLSLAPELRRTYDTVYAYLQDDVTRKRPSIDLALQLLCSSEADRWRLRSEVFSEGSSLFRHGLLHRADDALSPSGSSGLAQFLRVDERILHYVLGRQVLDARLAGFTTLVNPSLSLDDVLVDGAAKAKVMNLFAGLSTPPSGPFVICFDGPSGVGKRDLALGLCAEWGCPLLYLDLELLLARETDAAGLLRLAFREGLLLETPVYIALGDTPLPDGDRPKAWVKALARVVGEYAGLTFVSSEQPGPRVGRLFDGVACCRVDIPKPDAAVRQKAWKNALSQVSLAQDAPLDQELAVEFRMTPTQIRDAAELLVYQQAMTAVGELSAADVYAACRRQSHHKLAELAVKIEPHYSWDDVVLPSAQQQQLKDLCRQVIHRQRVFGDWGFGGKLARGRGVSALFAGPSGTGKTMAAEVIARELHRELYKVDLAGVVNKYIGETEKNLARIFLEAEASHAILFFDEADALFGKRTKVTDAHDRYANIETSYLLQRVEAYEGVVILATNLRDNIDEAFTRRLAFVVDFPFPHIASRKAIWQTHFPPQAPVDRDVDYDWLSSQLQVTGGAIKNIVVTAAFLAAADGGAIGMDHVLRGARREFEKIGKLWDEHSFAPLAR